eukprot:COSAG01_NODE_159_length_23702_cov_119.507585_17_plen_76_part_00
MWGLYGIWSQLLRCAVLCDDEADWLAVVVAMAVGRSNAQQAGSQDLATVAGSEVRPSLQGWFSGTSSAGWFWGEN